MFNQHPDFFYMFEPLHSLGVAAKRRDATAREATEHLKARILYDVISCNFSAWEYHFKTYFKDEDFGGWQHSRDIQQACYISEKYFKLSISFKKICPLLYQDIPAVLNAICVRRKHSAVTLAQARNFASLSTLLREPNQRASSPSGGLTVADEQLLREEGLYPVISRAGGEPAFSTSGPDVRLLLLVRDPRAWVTSRLRQLYENVTQFQPGHVTVARPQDYCDWVLAITGSEPTSRMNNTWSKPHGLQGRFAAVRHEDVVDRPLQMARKVYRFVGLPLHLRVVSWLQKNTGNERTSPDMFSSRRNLQEPVDSWRAILTFAAIKKIQEMASCRTVMGMFSYKMVRHVADLNSTVKSRKGEKREDVSTS
ncbi:CHST3 [Branchiostoma lanceolatum]|uniref:CHST3 protein n=2 Tax=Branchiostoma lanceolatum TaxID=7740 RepID=A0A8K0A3X0_BRALA|nr:CHST3 [Branchiostoma lanceolatum]